MFQAMPNGEDDRKTLRGRLRFKPYAEGTKSDSVRPCLDLPDGSRRLLYRAGDNPFVNESLVPYDDRDCELVGRMDDRGCFLVDVIEAIPEAGDGPIL